MPRKPKTAKTLNRTHTLAILRQICEWSDSVDGSIEAAEEALVNIRACAADALEHLGAPIPGPAEEVYEEIGTKAGRSVRKLIEEGR